MASFEDTACLLMNLQQVSSIVQSFGGQTQPETIAKLATDGLVQQFDVTFARIWLMESTGLALRLVASSGMYTHIDGFFAKVPVGAFKVGKIAQNRIPFLSNRLADESWVKDRNWAIAHQITGFAGYPLTLGDSVVGVLAVFSTQPLSPEFLEILQGLCATLALVLDYSQRLALTTSSIAPLSVPVLSEQIAQILSKARLTLVGTECTLSVATSCLLLRIAEVLRYYSCHYCRLTYEESSVTLEAMIEKDSSGDSHEASNLQLNDLQLATTLLEGVFDIQQSPAQKMVQWIIRLPYAKSARQNIKQLPKLPSSDLSEREREILTLLSQGFRDRDIAAQLVISESTVKFHMNNVLAKLKARTRYQALYKAIMQGEIE
jgi:DNA-binding CsgD family transcriptional regulator